jgi:hypothetical protein
MGDGPNAVAIEGASLSGKLTIKGGDDGNAIAVETTSVTGATLINTGALADAIAIVDCILLGATTINSGGDGDAIAIVGNTSRAKLGGKLTISTGGDGDALAIVNVDSKAISINTGDDADAISLDDILMTGGLSVKTGADVDVLSVSGILQSGSGANLFDLGADGGLMDVEQSLFSGATTMNLGNGTGSVLAIDDCGFNNTFTLNSQGTGDLIGIEFDVADLGVTTFAKAAKFNLGANSTVFISTVDPATKTNFLSTVSFSSALPGSTVTVDPLNTSFAKPPKLKNVVLV